MQPPPMPSPARSRPPGPRLLPSLVTIGVGLVISFVAVVLIVIPLLGTFTSSSYAVPGELRLHLHHAKYTVYQHTGTRSTFGTGHDDPSVVRIDASMLTVRGTDGTSVPVELDAGDETITRGSNVYRGTLEFEAPANAQYDLNFTNAAPTTVVVARSITDALHSVLGWFAVGALGGAVVITGVVMLIVGATRRGRAKRAVSYGGYGGWGPPPGSAPQWPAQYPPAQYPPPQYPPPSYPPPQYPPGQYPPPQYPPSPPPG